MTKTKLIDKLNNQKGLTSGEVIIALMIILLSLSVIGMVYVNLVNNSRVIDRKTGATRIATNIIENIDMTYFDNIEKNLKSWSDNGDITYDGQKYVVNSGVKIFETTIPSGYRVEITVETPDNANYDILKNVKVAVKYNVGNDEQTVELNRVISREVVRECNSPNFENDYLAQLNNLTKDTAVFSYGENPESSGGSTIICPLKYDGSNYKIITDENEVKSMWYSYSNKQWARVLLLTATEYQECQDIAQISKYLTGDNSYVWIPRFGVLNGGDLSNSSYFKYKNTEFAILSSYYKSDKGNLIYNYLQIPEQDWSTNNGISFESNDLTGRWCRYSEIKDINSDAYKLNNSNFGPLLEY